MTHWTSFGLRQHSIVCGKYRFKRLRDVLYTNAIMTSLLPVCLHFFPVTRLSIMNDLIVFEFSSKFASRWYFYFPYTLKIQKAIALQSRPRFVWRTLYIGIDPTNFRLTQVGGNNGGWNNCTRQCDADSAVASSQATRNYYEWKWENENANI